MDIIEGKTNGLMSENNRVEENKKVGFVKLFRSLTDWEWYTEPLTARLFIHLILKANWETKQWRGKTIKRGQYVTSNEKLSLETGLTISEVRTSIDRLMKSKDIIKLSTNQYTTITVVKYDDYQDNDKENRKRITNKPQTNHKQIATTKESKEYKEVKEKRESTLAFDYLKNNYPKRFKKEFQKVYSDKITNGKGKKDFVSSFDNKVTIEVENNQLKWTENSLFARLSNFASRWVDNENKFKKEEEPPPNYSLKVR